MRSNHGDTNIILHLFGLAQSIAISVSISQGFGKSLRLLDSFQITYIEKVTLTSYLQFLRLILNPQSHYASDLLYITANCLAKCSVALLLARMTRTKKHLIGCNIILITSILWRFASFLAVAIRCNISHPWLTIHEQCTDLVSP